MNEGSPLRAALFQALLFLLHAAFTLEHSFFKACVFLPPPLCLCSPSLGSCLSFSVLPTSPGISLFSLFFPLFSSIQFPISFLLALSFSFKSSFSLLNSASVFKGQEKLEKWLVRAFSLRCTVCTDLLLQTRVCASPISERAGNSERSPLDKTHLLSQIRNPKSFSQGSPAWP